MLIRKHTMIYSVLTAAIVVSVAAVKNTIVLHSNFHCQADRAGHWLYTPYPYRTQLVWKKN